MQLKLDLGTANPKQARFYRSNALYTAYGGARGGGKSHAVRTLALLSALREPGLRVLIVRRTYPELESTLIEPFLAMLPDKIATYNGTKRCVSFLNSSTVRFGHLGSDEGEYQGQEFDRIFIDEATQFTERQFRTLGACLRGSSVYARRMYLTCNPGGVGHAWVKRLFVDKQYKDGENAEDYCFIPATVEDNRVLMKNSPQYVALLDMLPEDIRAAHRYGDWNALSGAYFPELRESIHRRNAVDIRGKTLYRAIDYGLDMLACLWIAVDENGCAEVYRELKEPGLIVSAACARILESTSQSENIALTFAPPDLRSRQKDSGRSLQELFALSGVPLTFASNSRTAGWLSLRERFRQDKPTLFISRSCPKLWHDLATIQHSKTDPNDCATEPHELTHLCDALRYFAVMRPFKTPRENAISSYERFMLGAMGW